MAYYPRRRRGIRSKPRPKTKSVRKAIRQVKKTNFVNAVKKVIRSQNETKMAYLTNSNASLIKYNSGIDSLGDITPILPSITESVNENGRIGDQIRSQTLQIKGYIKFDYSSVPASKVCSVGVRMMCVSLKSAQNADAVNSTATPLYSLLKKGGTSTAFTGVLSDLTAPINTDLFTVHSDKLYYLKQDMIIQNGTVTNNWVAADVSKLLRFFTINVKCKNKQLKYEDGISSGVYPTNFYPFILLGYSYLDGSSPDIVSTPLGMEFTSCLKYEDS